MSVPSERRAGPNQPGTQPGDGRGECDRLSAEPDPHRVLRRTWPRLLPHRRLMAAAVGTSLAATVAELAGPVLVGVAVDAVLEGRRSHLGAAVGAYGAVTVTLAGLQAARGRLAARAGEDFLSCLRADVASRLLGRPLAFFDRHPAGELVARATTDVDALSGFVRSGLPRLVDSLLLLAVTAAVLFGASWQLGLVSLLYLPAFALSVHWYRRGAGGANAAYSAARAATTGAVGETLSARPLLQGIGATGPWAQRVAQVDGALVGAVAAVLRVDNRLSVLGFFQLLTLALVVAVGGSLVAAEAVSVGAVATVALALRQLFGPLDSLSWLIGRAEAARSSMARVLEVLAAPDLAAAKGAHHRGPALHEGLDVELAGVTYAYDGGTPALADVTLRVPAGQRVAICGATGSGKSTLAKVAAGLLDPAAGTVVVGGRPVGEWRTADLRRAVVLLPQEGCVVAGTVADNLRLVPGDHTDGELAAAVEGAGLGPWLARLPAGLAAPLADRGADLSAGERQLVSLARAAVADPAVLVLDEATADVDPSTEALVAEALDRVGAARTVIVVAHRPATAARADRVVTLAGGRVVSDHPAGRRPPGNLAPLVVPPTDGPDVP